MTKNTKTNTKYINYRKEGRIIAFQTIFSFEFNNASLDELIKLKWLERNISKEALGYAIYLINGTINNLQLIDSVIKSKLRNWDFERISNIDKAVLRFSIFSMFFEKELSEKIIINEAVEIVKNFGAKDSYKFVNGILDAIKRTKTNS